MKKTNKKTKNKKRTEQASKARHETYLQNVIVTWYFYLGIKQEHKLQMYFSMKDN